MSIGDNSLQVFNIIPKSMFYLTLRLIKLGAIRKQVSYLAGVLSGSFVFKVIFEEICTKGILLICKKVPTRLPFSHQCSLQYSFKC